MADTALRPAAAAGLVGQLSDCSDGQEEPEGLRYQRLKSVAAVEFQSPFDALRVPAVQNIEHNDGDTNGVGRDKDAPEGVNQEIASEPPTRISRVDANHGDVGRRDLPVSWARPGIGR